MNIRFYFILMLLIVVLCDKKNDKKIDNVDLSKYKLTLEKAEKYGKIALYGIQKEFPYKPGIVFENKNDIYLPREFHPVFYGCFDWHSAVHGHWLLVKILKMFSGEMKNEDSIRTVLNKHLTKGKIKKEIEYFNRPNSKSFERTYGWAWLLKLSAELESWEDIEGEKWAENLRPLAETIVNRYTSFLPKQKYPIRRGVHPNTAFGIAFAYDYALECNHDKLKEVLVERAKTYFLKDKDYPVEWEIEGDAFFSPSLMEAYLMCRILNEKDFKKWFEEFLPEFFTNEKSIIKNPAIVTDRSDPKLVHLDGLNLSRCCGLAYIAKYYEDDKKRMIDRMIKKHLDYSLTAVESKNYEGSHWLATFAVLATDALKEIDDEN